MVAPRPDGQAVAPAQGSRGKKRGSRSGDDAAGTLLALLMAQQQTSAQSVAQAASKPAGPTFNPADLLAAKQGLDAAYADGQSVVDQRTGAVQNGQPYWDPEKGWQTGFENPLAPKAASDLPNTDAVREAQAAYDAQLRTRRADALNTGHQTGDKLLGNKQLKEKVDKLSWDEYNNMSAADRSAVDYNTQLYQAAKRDNRNRDQDVDTDSQEYMNYASAFEKMFPNENVGEAKHSPETVALLKQIGYKDDGAGSLNDFLNFNASVTTKDLENLGKSADLGLRRGGAGSPFSSPVKEERMDFLGGLVTSTENAQAAALERGNKLLSTFSQRAFSLARQDDVAAMGGAVANTVPKNEALAKTFNDYFTLLADKDLEAKGISLDELFGTLQGELSEPDRKKFVKYVTDRMINSEQDGSDLVSSPNVQTPRQAQEIAKLLELKGFGKGGVSSG